VRSDAGAPVQACAVARPMPVSQSGDRLSDTDGRTGWKWVRDGLVGRDQVPIVGQADDDAVADAARESHDAVAGGHDQLPAITRQIDASMPRTPSMGTGRVTRDRYRRVQRPVESGGNDRWRGCAPRVGPGRQRWKQPEGDSCQECRGAGEIPE